jgi:hypothetical protein
VGPHPQPRGLNDHTGPPADGALTSVLLPSRPRARIPCSTPSDKGADAGGRVCPV